MPFAIHVDNYGWLPHERHLSTRLIIDVYQGPKQHTPVLIHSGLLRSRIASSLSLSVEAEAPEEPSGLLDLKIRY